MPSVLQFILVAAVIALAVRFVIRREKKLGSDIVQDVKDLVE